MKKLIIAALSSIVAFQAMAADLPVVKAPASGRTFYDGSGCYWGLSALGENTKTDIAGPAGTTGTMFAAGAAAGLSVGCQKGTGTRFIAIEASALYTNLGASNPVAGGDVNSRLEFVQRIKFGGPVTAMLDSIPNLSLTGFFPTLPPVPGGVTSTAHPYIMLGLHEHDVSANFGLANGRAWQVAPSVGVGIMQQLSNGTVMDFWAEVSTPSQGFTIGGNAGNVSTGRKYLVGVSILN